MYTAEKSPRPDPRTPLKFASRYLDGDSNFKIEALIIKLLIKQGNRYIIWSSWGTEVSWYIVRCPDGNHLGYPFWDKVILNFWNDRTQLHDVFDKHKYSIDQIILKYTN